MISSTTGSSDLAKQRAVALNKKRRRRFISQWTNLPPVWTYLRLHWHREFWLIIFLRNTENDANGITSTVTNSSHKPCSSMFISTGKTRQFIGCLELRVKKFSDYCVNDRGSVIICQASEKLPQLLPHWIIHLFLSTVLIGKAIFYSSLLFTFETVFSPPPGIHQICQIFFSVQIDL